MVQSPEESRKRLGCFMKVNNRASVNHIERLFYSAAGGRGVAKHGRACGKKTTMDVEVGLFDFKDHRSIDGPEVVAAH
jgi:hypothetical protein